MERETNHELARFTDVSAHLHHHRSTDIMHLRYYLDTRMKQRASKEYLLGKTPYRFSFRKDQLVNAKRAQKQAPTGPVKVAETRLPRLPMKCESLVSGVACKCWKDYLDEEVDNLELPSVTRKTSNSATSDVIKASSSSSNSRESLNSVKKSICNLPRIQHQEDSGKRSDRTKRIEGNANWFGNLLTNFGDGQEGNIKFSRVMADGSRVTATQRKLYLEVFMPRMQGDQSCLWEDC